MNLYQRPRNLYMALVAFLLVPAAGVRAQGGAPAAAASAPTKIAVLNVREAIGTTAEGKQASLQLQTQFNPQQSDLDNVQKQIQELQGRLSNGARTLSDDEKARLQRQGEMLMRQMQRKQDDLNEQVQAAQGDIVDEIGRKMMEVLDRYSKDKGFAIVLDSSAQGTPVVYGAPQLDITQDVIRLYDQEYPLKAAAPAPAAAPARPAASPGAAQPRPAQPASPAPAK
jgi:outer membrane protein